MMIMKRQYDKLSCMMWVGEGMWLGHDQFDSFWRINPNRDGLI